MISLDQVHVLERKVESAVKKIIDLQNENDMLHSECTSLQLKVKELNEKLSSVKEDETKIEEGILHVLERLNSVEDSVRNLDTKNEESLQENSTSSVQTEETISEDNLSLPNETIEEDKEPDQITTPVNGQFDIF